MSSDVISIALFGAGRIGAMHAANLAAHPRYQLTAVYDADTDAAVAVAARCATAVAVTADAVFADSGVDALLVASSTETHCDYILRAARAGKAVLCEKPVDKEMARVRQCGEALAALDDVPPIQIGFNRRFDPGHASLRDRLHGGEIGKLEKLIITSRDPGLPSPAYLASCGGLFCDMMIHDFDLARALLPEEPARLIAADAALVPREADATPDKDTAMVIMQTASGVLCHINCSRRAAYGYDQRVEAFGAAGMLISGNQTATAVEHYGKTATAAKPPLLHFFTERYQESYRRQLDAFADVVVRAAPPVPDFEDGKRALMLADAAAESARRGAWVSLDDEAAR